MGVEDDMWHDYEHYIHTGELSEYFEDESEPITYRHTGEYRGRYKAKTKKNNEPTLRQKIEDSIWYKVFQCVTIIA